MMTDAAASTLLNLAWHNLLLTTACESTGASHVAIDSTLESIQRTGLVVAGLPSAAHGPLVRCFGQPQWLPEGRERCSASKRG